MKLDKFLNHLVNQPPYLGTINISNFCKDEVIYIFHESLNYYYGNNCEKDSKPWIGYPKFQHTLIKYEK